MPSVFIAKCCGVNSCGAPCSTNRNITTLRLTFASVSVISMTPYYLGNRCGVWECDELGVDCCAEGATQSTYTCACYIFLNVDGEFSYLHSDGSALCSPIPELCTEVNVNVCTTLQDAPANTSNISALATAEPSVAACNSNSSTSTIWVDRCGNKSVSSFGGVCYPCVPTGGFPIVGTCGECVCQAEQYPLSDKRKYKAVTLGKWTMTQTDPANTNRSVTINATLDYVNTGGDGDCYACGCFLQLNVVTSGVFSHFSQGCATYTQSYPGSDETRAEYRCKWESSYGTFAAWRLKPFLLYSVSFGTTCVNCNEVCWEGYEESAFNYGHTGACGEPICDGYVQMNQGAPLTMCLPTCYSASTQFGQLHAADIPNMFSWQNIPDQITLTL